MKNYANKVSIEGEITTKVKKKKDQILVNWTIFSEQKYQNWPYKRYKIKQHINSTISIEETEKFIKELLLPPAHFP